VIDAIDDALETWLGSVLRPAQIEIASRLELDTPAATPPVLRAFLYDVVEEDCSRGAYLDDVRDDDGRIVARLRPPRHFALSYLLTVSAPDARAEHALLGRVVAAAIESESLPVDLLPDALRDGGHAVPIRVAPARAAGTGAAAVMAAADAGWRSYVDLVLVVPVLPTPITEIAPPATQLDLDVNREPNASAPIDATPPADLPPRKWTTVRRREH
jgi:hypothetical protein